MQNQAFHRWVSWCGGLNLNCPSLTSSVTTLLVLNKMSASKKPLIGSFFGSYSELRARSTVAHRGVKAGDH
jgi:hypothetical protein